MLHVYLLSIITSNMQKVTLSDSMLIWDIDLIWEHINH